MNKNFEKMMAFSASFFVLVATKTVKLSLFIGSKIAHFSAINILGPVFGAFFGISNFIALLGFSLVLKFLGFSLVPFATITFGLPTLFASLTLKSLLKSEKNISSFVLSVVLPIVCMGLFFIAPSSVGFAKLYAAYWLIPVLIYFTLNFIKSNSYISNLFLASLSSTFVAHATGSIIWAFSVNMLPHQWVLLIPLVALERIVFASAISISYIGLEALSKFLSDKAPKYQNFFSTNF